MIGPTNAGKTTAIRSLLYQLARQNRPADVRFLLLTVKPRDWLPFNNLLQTMAVVTEVPEIGEALAWAKGNVVERLARQVSCPHLFVVVDDAVYLLSLSPEIGQHSREISSLGRAAGCI